MKKSYSMTIEVSDAYEEDFPTTPSLESLVVYALAQLLLVQRPELIHVDINEEED